MTPDDFKAWRARMRYSQEDAALALGLSRATVQAYETGHHKGTRGGPSTIPKAVALACGALQLGLLAYPPPNGTPTPAAA